MSRLGIQPANEFFSEPPMNEAAAAAYKLRNQILEDLDRQKRECIRSTYIVPVREWTVQLETVLKQVMAQLRRKGYSVKRVSRRGMGLGLEISKAQRKIKTK